MQPAGQGNIGHSYFIMPDGTVDKTYPQLAGADTATQIAMIDDHQLVASINGGSEFLYGDKSRPNAEAKSMWLTDPRTKQQWSVVTEG